MGAEDSEVEVVADLLRREQAARARANELAQIVRDDARRIEDLEGQLANQDIEHSRKVAMLRADRKALAKSLRRVTARLGAR